MKTYFLAAFLLLAGCSTQPVPSVDNRMAARADTRGTGILTTSSGTDNVKAFWCDGGVTSTSSSTGLPVCTPALQIQQDDAGDNAVVVYGFLETGVSFGTSLTGTDGGSITETFSTANNNIIRFTGNPGYVDGGGAASVLIILPAAFGGATGYSVILDFTLVTMTGVTSLGFKVGSSSTYNCSSLGIGPYMYVVASNGSSAPTVGAMVKP